MYLAHFSRMLVKKSSVRLKDKRRRESYLWYGAVCTFALALIGGVAYLSRLPEVTVTSVAVTGAVYADEKAVTEVVNKTLDGTYALVVPKRLSYVVPRGAVAAAVTSAFPLVESVEVERTSTQSLTVHVTERTPHALWCSAACYRLDTYGLAFAQAQAEDRYRTYEGSALQVGELFLAGDFHDFDRFVTLLEGVSPARIPRVRTEGTDAFLYLEHGGEIRILRDADPERTKARLEAIFSSESFDTTRALDYVELRFGEKALVKYRE